MYFWSYNKFKRVYICIFLLSLSTLIGCSSAKELEGHWTHTNSRDDIEDSQKITLTPIEDNTQSRVDRQEVTLTPIFSSSPEDKPVGKPVDKRADFRNRLRAIVKEHEHEKEEKEAYVITSKTVTYSSGYDGDKYVSTKPYKVFEKGPSYIILEIGQESKQVLTENKKFLRFDLISEDKILVDGKIFIRVK